MNGPATQRVRSYSHRKEASHVQDDQILDLYFSRNPDAIQYTSDKYGAYLSTIACNILHDPQDAEECVSDTYLRTWNAIPPQRPHIFRAFLARITRNLSLNRFQQSNALKRSRQVTLALDELSDCVSGRDDVESSLGRKALIEALNDWLSDLPVHKRCIFLRRYWYFDPIRDIAMRCGMTETAVTVTLHRLRSNLRTYLTERGFDL